MGSYHLIHIWAILAVLATGLFTGAAIYVSLIEHPARLLCPTPVALAQWKPSYRRATWMQASLAVLGGVFAVATWWGDGGNLFLTGGVVLGAVVPFTGFGILPTNRALQAVDLDPASARARELLIKWGKLHAVRSVLSLIAFLLMLVQSLWYWGL